MMKRFIAIATVAIMLFLSTSNSYACRSWFGFTSHDRGHQHQNGGDHGAVGAPLDGGLLAILAAAGGGYFIARKRKKNKEQ